MATETVIVDCAHIARPSAYTIDRIARLNLALRERGCECRLANPSQALLDLIAFVGLGGVLCVESGWQAEQWEQPCGIEEEGELPDPPV